jgi:hypothetical protein
MALPTLVVPDLSAQFEAARAQWARQFGQIFTVDPSTVDVETKVEEYRHDFTAEIEAGVALLDAKLSRETWLPRVNLSTLNLAYEMTCMAAQAVGCDFVDACAYLGMPHSTNDWHEVYQWADDRGFAVSDDLCDKYGDVVVYGQLTDQWKTKIEQLRAEVA